MPVIRRKTGYVLDEGQMILAETAAGRKGIQPMVRLTVQGKERADVKVNEEVVFEAEIMMPEDCGSLEEVHWSFEGADEFLPEGEIGEEKLLEDGTRIVKAAASHKFTDPGTWFPVVKVACNTAPGDIYTRIRNQARVRAAVQTD